MKRTELEKKLEELTLEYLENHKGRHNIEQRDSWEEIRMLTRSINAIKTVPNGSVTPYLSAFNLGRYLDKHEIEWSKDTHGGSGHVDDTFDNIHEMLKDLIRDNYVLKED